MRRCPESEVLAPLSPVTADPFMTMTTETTVRRLPAALLVAAALLTSALPARAAEVDEDEALDTADLSAEAVYEDEADEPVVTTASAPAAAATFDRLDPVTGARLGNSGDRLRVHTLVRRTERAEGKHELSLIAPIQINGKFTDHIGTGLEYLYHLRESLAVTVGGTYFPYAALSPFTDQLVDVAKQQPYPSSAVLLQYEAHAGLEVSPIYGKFALFDWRVVQFGFYVGASAGVAQTRVQLRRADAARGLDRTFGDAGLRPVGHLNTGFRLFLGDFMALRLEVRDTVFSDSVTRINGCTKSDVDKMLGGQGVSASCNPDAFADREADGRIAADLLKEPSSDVLNNIQFAAAISVLF